MAMAQLVTTPDLIYLKTIDIFSLADMITYAF